MEKQYTNLGSSLSCQNCGREHEGRLIETFTDGDGKPLEIVVCEHPRYEEKNV
jgi:hypothetical protein